MHAAAGGAGLPADAGRARCGARSSAPFGSEAKAELAREAGANEVILYTQQDFEAEVKRLTGGAASTSSTTRSARTTFDKSLNCLKPRGYMVLFGQSSGPVPPVDPLHLAARARCS